MEGWNPLSGLAHAIDGSVAVLSNPGDAKVILFTLVIGALIATVESSGGVRGFVAFLEARRWVDTPRKARLPASAMPSRSGPSRSSANPSPRRRRLRRLSQHG